MPGFSPDFSPMSEYEQNKTSPFQLAVFVIGEHWKGSLRIASKLIAGKNQVNFIPLKTFPAKQIY